MALQTVAPSSWIHSITTLVDEARFSLLLAASPPPQLVPVSPSHGKACLLHDSCWVSALVQRMPRYPSTRPKWPQLGFEALSSCSGSFGSWPVSILFLRVVWRSLIVARRYLLGFLRQCHCQRRRSYCLASPTGFGVHPILHPGLWYLFLSRVPSLAHEARPACQRIQINDTLASSPDHRRKGLLLFECDIRRGTQRGSWRWLLCPLVGLFRST